MEVASCSRAREKKGSYRSYLQYPGLKQDQSSNSSNLPYKAVKLLIKSGVSNFYGTA